MPGRKRPPTAWIEACTRDVIAASHVSENIARKICAANWWHRMSDESRARAVAKYEPSASTLAAVGPDRRFVKIHRGATGRGKRLSPPAPTASRRATHAEMEARLKYVPMSAEEANASYRRLPTGKNHQHGPGPRRCPKCGV